MIWLSESRALLLSQKVIPRLCLSGQIKAGLYRMSIEIWIERGTTHLSGERTV